MSSSSPRNSSFPIGFCSFALQIQNFLADELLLTVNESHHTAPIHRTVDKVRTIHETLIRQHTIDENFLTFLNFCFQSILLISSKVGTQKSISNSSLVTYQCLATGTLSKKAPRFLPPHDPLVSARQVQKLVASCPFLSPPLRPSSPWKNVLTAGYV